MPNIRTSANGGFFIARAGAEQSSTKKENSMLYKQTYTGNGSKKNDWYFAFPFFQNADIRVVVDGAELSESQYAVRGDKTGLGGDIPYGGGSIEFVTAPSAGARIEICRDIKLERPVDYQPTAPVRANALNQDANFFLEILKELKHTLGNMQVFAELPSMQELFDSIADVRAQIADLGDLSGYMTAADLQPALDAIDDAAAQISELQSSVENIELPEPKRNTLGNAVVDIALNGNTHTAETDGFIAIGATSATSNFPQLFISDADDNPLFDMLQPAYSSGITPIAAGQKFNLVNSNHCRFYKFIPVVEE
jgi:hypothetical protein